MYQWDPLTWNFSVAAFFSSVETLKSLSGCVLGLERDVCVHEREAKYTKNLKPTLRIPSCTLV